MDTGEILLGLHKVDNVIVPEFMEQFMKPCRRGTLVYIGDDLYILTCIMGKSLSFKRHIR